MRARWELNLGYADNILKSLSLHQNFKVGVFKKYICEWSSNPLYTGF